MEIERLLPPDLPRVARQVFLETERQYRQQFERMGDGPEMSVSLSYLAWMACRKKNKDWARNYLAMSCRNAHIRHLRNHRRYRARYGNWAMPEDEVEVADPRQADRGLPLDLADALAELPAHQAEVCRRGALGEKLTAIAADLGVNKSTASRWHTTALGRLQIKLRPYADSRPRPYPLPPAA